MSVSLVVGHSEKKPGAKNKSFEVYEYSINNKLANDISEVTNVDVNIIYRNDGYNKLPFVVNRSMSKFVLSLHANAYNTKESGSEILYYYRSKQGKEVAQIFQDSIVKTLGLKDRGIKPKTSEDRGGYLLRYTYAPCIIMEPFFIDNDDDFLVFMCKYKEYVRVISKTIEEVYNNLI